MEQAETAAQIVSKAMAAYERGDWGLLRELTHPEAEVEMVLLDGAAARGQDELSDSLRAASTTIHRPRASRIDDVADDAAVMIGRIQHVDTNGGVSDRQAVWLTVLRDDKIWRTRVLASTADVPAAYEQLTGSPPASSR
jgi:ketosteroid isomerase-like protein